MLTRAARHPDELRADWELARAGLPLVPIEPLDWYSVDVLEITFAEPLEGRCVRLTLSDGTVVERDVSDLLRGPVFEPIARDAAIFRRLSVRHGTVTWPGDVDIAPETLIWDGPYPRDEGTRRPEPYLRLHLPTG